MHVRNSRVRTRGLLKHVRLRAADEMPNTTNSTGPFEKDAIVIFGEHVDKAINIGGECSNVVVASDNRVDLEGENGEGARGDLRRKEFLLKARSGVCSRPKFLERLRAAKLYLFTMPLGPSSRWKTCENCEPRAGIDNIAKTPTDAVPFKVNVDF